jgi:hypothetical protein
LREKVIAEEDKGGLHLVKKLTFEEVKSEFVSKGYTLLEEDYKNSKVKMMYICDKHPKHVQYIRLNDIKMGHGCRLCGRERINEAGKSRAVTQRHSIEDVQAEFRRRGYILVDREYTSARKPLTYVCNNHPDKHLTIRFKDLKDGSGCRYCAIDEMKLSMDVIRSRFAERGYTLLEAEHVNNHTPMRYLCPKHPDIETRITLSSLTNGRGCTHCAIEASRGKLSVHYNHDVPDEIRAKERRYDAELNVWRKAVYKRDSFACVKCGDNRGGNLNAHHKDGYAWCVDRRYDVDNGATLCETCHRKFHSAYGNKDNTESQFEKWINTKEASE